MDTTSVTTKGQVTIPVAVREALGLRGGSRLRFQVVGDHVEMHIADPAPPAGPPSGFGMLKVKGPVKGDMLDFDPASLLRRK
jgi:AbrB family looped-hinge helix DNA binding protein